MVIAQILNFRSKFDNFIYYWSISVSTGLKLSLAGILLSEKAHFVIVRAACRGLHTVENVDICGQRCVNVCSASSSIICSKTKQKRCLTLDG